MAKHCETYKHLSYFASLTCAGVTAQLLLIVIFSCASWSVWVSAFRFSFFVTISWASWSVWISAFRFSFSVTNLLTWNGRFLDLQWIILILWIWNFFSVFSCLSCRDLSADHFWKVKTLLCQWHFSSVCFVLFCITLCIV